MTKYYDGDYSISPVILKSIDGSRSLDITNQTVEIHVFESILSPVILGEIIMYDPFNILETFPVIGEEYVEFEWKIPSDKKGRQEKLIVTEVVDMTQEEDNRSKLYVLRLAAYDMYTSQRMIVSKKYKQDSTAMIRDLLYSDIKTDKTFVADSTKGIDDVTITKLHPFEAIDFIRRRALSPRYASSSFVFYQNYKGYFFKTIESTYEKNKKNIGDRIYTYSPDAAHDVTQWNYRNILAYEHVTHASTFNQIQTGGLHNQVAAFDIITGEVDKRTYQNEKYQQIDQSARGLHNDSFTRKYGDVPSTLFFTATDASLPEYDLPEKIGQLQGFVQNITSSLLWIEVYGDTLTTVGDVVEINLPEATGLTAPQNKKLISGNYFISKCRHILVLGNERHYTQSMELIKGSYLE